MNVYKYVAFGLLLESELEIFQLSKAPAEGATDVYIRRTDFSDIVDFLPERKYFSMNGRELRFKVDGLAKFRITDGCLIEVEEYHVSHADVDANDAAGDDNYESPEVRKQHLGVFLMGSCMGAILHQRDALLLHGSCVTNGKHTVLFTGDSGAGKSTTAAVFLAHGWQLLTDDVSCIRAPEKGLLVEPSYPSQKLWEDSLERYGRQAPEVNTLYRKDGSEKYGISVAEHFCREPHTLTTVVRLIPVDAPLLIEPVAGFAKVDQLVRNTYRNYMILPEKRQQHFQRCVTMAGKIRMYAAFRSINESCSEELYDTMVKLLEEESLMEGKE